MSLTFNSTEPDTVKFNGSDVDSVTLNGVEVWGAFLNKINVEELSTLLSIRDSTTQGIHLIHQTDSNLIYADGAAEKVYIFNKNTKTLTEKTFTQFGITVNTYYQNQGVNFSNINRYRVEYGRELQSSPVVIHIYDVDESTLTESLYDTITITGDTTIISAGGDLTSGIYNIIPIIGLDNKVVFEFSSFNENHCYLYDITEKTTELMTKNISGSLCTRLKIEYLSKDPIKGYGIDNNNNTASSYITFPATISSSTVPSSRKIIELSVDITTKEINVTSSPVTIINNYQKALNGRGIYKNKLLTQLTGNADNILYGGDQKIVATEINIKYTRDIINNYPEETSEWRHTAGTIIWNQNNKSFLIYAK